MEAFRVKREPKKPLEKQKSHLHLRAAIKIAQSYGDSVQQRDVSPLVSKAPLHSYSARAGAASMARARPTPTWW